MGLFNFLKKNPHPPSKDYDAYFSALHERLTAIEQSLVQNAALLSKTEARQKETSLQLDEINERLQDGTEPFVNALTAVADGIEGFYRFAAEDKASALYPQAKAVWDAVKDGLASVGVSVIDNAGTPFDFRLETVANTENHPEYPNQWVLNTLQCGYAFNGGVIRRASVTVNKHTEGPA